jgi:hypothetical protein
MSGKRIGERESAFFCNLKMIECEVGDASFNVKQVDLTERKISPKLSQDTDSIKLLPD